MEIKYIKNNEIDKKKWDKCIDEAQNGLVYAYSWFLDVTAKKKWKALVIGDYEFVMPFVENKKYFIKYIYQPFFTQQLGVFSEKEISSEIVEGFLNELSKKYKFINTNLNFANKINLQNERINFELCLNDTYEKLFLKFSKNAKTYIKKALKENQNIFYNTTPKEIIQLQNEKTSFNIDNKSRNILLKLINKSIENNHCKIYSIRNDKNELISFFFFVFSHNRAYYIFGASNNEGRKKFAAFMLMNQFIKDHAGQDLILDFEGSMIPGVARFFKGWGAKNNPYYNFKLNRLPLLLRIFKK